MHYNCDSDDGEIMNRSPASGRDVNDNNVRNVGNIFVSFHADDVVILGFLLLIKRVIVACTMEAMVTVLLLFVIVIMSFMLRLFLFFDFRS